MPAGPGPKRGSQPKKKGGAIVAQCWGPSPLVKWLGVVLVLAALWSQLAPPEWGGQTTFLVVQGTSMLPRFQPGAVVAVRPAPTYAVGTLAAYRYPSLHSVFFHQIVGIRGFRYTFQGLHNRFPDPYHPTQRNVIGQLWFSVPEAGLWLAFWRQPLHAALLVAGLALVSWWSAGSQRRRKSMPLRKTTAPGASGSPPPSTWTGILSALLVVAAVLCLWVYLLPAAILHSQVVSYRQQSHFTYRASVPKSVVYPQGLVAPGSPVAYPAAQMLHTSFTYVLQVPGGRSLGGTATLAVVLVSTSGWREPVGRPMAATFHGDAVRVDEAIDVGQVFATVREVSQMTHDSVDTYQLVLTASVHAVGTAGGHTFLAAQTPSMAFVVQPAWLQLEKPTLSTLAQYLNPTTPGFLRVTIPSANTLGVLGLRLPVSTARLIVSGTLALLGAAMGVALRRARQREAALGEPARIARQFGNLIIPVEELPFSPAARSIRVGSMAGLVRLATQFERIILHAVDAEGQHVYLLENTGESYYFSVRDEGSRRPESWIPEPLSPPG